MPTEECKEETLKVPAPEMGTVIRPGTANGRWKDGPVVQTGASREIPEDVVKLAAERFKRHVAKTVKGMTGQYTNIHYSSLAGESGHFSVSQAEISHTPLSALFKSRGIDERPFFVQFSSMTINRGEAVPLPRSAWERPVAHYLTEHRLQKAAAAASAGQGIAARVKQNLSHMSPMDKAWAAALGISAGLCFYESMRSFTTPQGINEKTGKPELTWSQMTYGAFQAAFGALMAYSTASRVMGR